MLLSVYAYFAAVKESLIQSMVSQLYQLRCKCVLDPSHEHLVTQVHHFSLNFKGWGKWGWGGGSGVGADGVGVCWLGGW
jgi:hypothetical protein